MKTLNLQQMENLEAGWRAGVSPPSGECVAMFAGVAVGAIGAFLNPILGAGMMYLGLDYIDENC